MKSKKILGILMSATLTLGLVAPAVNVQAAQSKNYSNGSYYGAYHAAQANEDKIIDMLKKQGKITENTSPEEIQKIIQEYLGEQDPATYLRPNERDVKLTEKMNDKAKAYGVMQDQQLSMKKGNDAPQYVQPEGEWTAAKVTVKPLVILMDYQDFKYTDMKEDETDFYYDDYSKNHYQNILFNEGTYKGPDGIEDFVTMKEWYKEQSGGSFVVDGGIAGWYTAKHEAAYYGKMVGTTNDVNARALIKEALDNVAKDPTINLADYDHEDPYDLDGDGNTNEPDGIVDKFIVVHAGVGQEAGGGSLGTDAIWSHNWTVGSAPYTVKDTKGKNFSVYTYNIDPQDGAPGVFCHEFGHAIGLPDEYDTNYSGTGEPVGYWSIMSSGSWTGIVPGAEPSGFSPYAKQFLQANYGGNWLTGTSVNIDNVSDTGLDLLIDEASTKGTNNDVVRIDLPQKVTTVVTPTSGKKAYYSTSGTNLNTSMSTTLDLTGKTNIALKFKAMYDIEKWWDYASVQVKEVGGTDWATVAGNITTTDDLEGSGQNPGNGITGKSDGWIDAEFSLNDYAGKNIELKIVYFTDGYVNMSGLYVDDVAIEADGATILSDDVESDLKFQLNGFITTDGKLLTNHYYLIEWRNQTGTDAGLARLRGGAMSYDPGLLVWYVDELYDNNWTGDHPGEGYLGIVDADQNAVLWNSVDTGEFVQPASNGYQMHDAAFSLRKGKIMNITIPSGLTTLDGKNFMHPYFDDSRNYLNPGTPDTGKNVPNYGLKIYVTGESKDRSVGKIHISRTTK